MDTLLERYRRVQQQIADSCEHAGRDTNEVALVAVSKRQSAQDMAALHALGVEHMGENYVQEWRQKCDLLQGSTIRWHLIGALQRNKIRWVVGQVALIHSVDTVDLIHAMGERLKRFPAEIQECLVQVNTGLESQKNGCPPEQLPLLLDAFGEYPSLRCVGLMCLPPATHHPEASRPHFRLLRELLQKESVRKRPQVSLKTLSMGMSQDFSVAIEEGATLIRIGTALFGARTH